MFFLRFITQVRFSYLDYAWLSAFLVLFMQHKFLLAFLAFFVGILFSVYIERKVHRVSQEEIDKLEKAAKDKKWQWYADQNRKIDAIKAYRVLFGSNLKEAHDVVKEYMGVH